MKSSLNSLKHAEMFALLAMVFLLMIGYLQEKLTSSRPPEEPPIILIPSEDLSFETARAFPRQGSNYLRDYIKNEIVPQIEKQLKLYDVNMLEIIGHTDGNPISGVGNLDKNLLNDLARLDANQIEFNDLVTRFKKLEAGSNADLGLIRALIVIKTLQDLQKTGECKCEVKAFRAYSAAQLYLSGNKPEPVPSSRKDNPNRRRIEIRFTKWNPN
ncbi:MAG: flagellar motor protein [Scytonema sp. PMC 1069.18]|nr:flagellar motor protein [Scytonema sp. PMC 1069.18]MEC4883175.1 flagellar motor protein [Scytonema sp. PMC 1070.18]